MTPESRIASVTGSKKTDGFPVHLLVGKKKKKVWLKFGCVLFENKKDVLINWAKTHLNTLLILP